VPAAYLSAVEKLAQNILSPRTPAQYAAPRRSSRRRAPNSNAGAMYPRAPRRFAPALRDAASIFRLRRKRFYIMLIAAVSHPTAALSSTNARGRRHHAWL
jgi:hypothetical protein